MRNSTESCAVNHLRPKWSTKNKNWIPEQLWIQVKRHVPIPCVDIILENNKGQILLGWRCILPYRNVWALPGGRLLMGERLQAAAARVLDEYALTATTLILVGVFPIRFRDRSDVSICVAAKHAAGDAQPDGKEFSKFYWTQDNPKRLGANYRRMIVRWNTMRNIPNVSRISNIDTRQHK